MNAEQTIKKDQNENQKSASTINTPLLVRTPMQQTNWRTSLLVVALCVAIYVPVMGVYGMFDPWETHYTEVARQFMVRHDWLSTYWHNGVGPEGNSETNFWTKPVGSFWMSGLSLRLFGYGAHTTGEQIATGNIEWAVRLPFFLCGLLGIFAVYLLCARLFSRRSGIISAVILSTAPLYFMITRQAMTDMPYVGPMSAGLAFFILGLCGEKEELPRRGFHLGKRFFDWPHAPSYYTFVASFLAIMGLQLYGIIDGLRRVALPILVGGRPLSAGVVMFLYIGLMIVFLWLSRKTRTKNEVYLYTFYMLVAVAGLSKGLIGALQPGFIILVYILASREWRILAEVVLLRGLMVAVCVACPWFHGMVLRYGMSFWNELFGTEQFRRLTIGEQAQAKGTFEYYVSQIGYGLFPWVAFLPAALVNFFFPRSEEKTGRERAYFFVIIWFIAATTLFTLTLTKYHHYILPALPPAAMLIAIYLDELLEGKTRGLALSLITALGVLLVTGWDLFKQPAQWVWMFTYLYEPNWAKGAPSGGLILTYALIFGVFVIAIFFAKIRKAAIWATVLCAAIFGGYVLNWYQLKVAPHWSQKKVISSYYQQRKSADEELIAWQFNWRGETWYTGAEVVVSKSLDNTAIVQYLKDRPNRRFFFITERGRYPSLRSVLPTPKGQSTLTIVDDTNIHYVLAAADL